MSSISMAKTRDTEKKVSESDTKPDPEQESPPADEKKSTDKKPALDMKSCDNYEWCGNDVKSAENVLCVECRRLWNRKLSRKEMALEPKTRDRDEQAAQKKAGKKGGKPSGKKGGNQAALGEDAQSLDVEKPQKQTEPDADFWQAMGSLAGPWYPW